MDLRHDVLAVRHERGVSRRAQRHVQHRALFGDVDLVATEHGVDSRAQAGLVRKLNQEPQRLIGDAILGVVERQASGFRRQALTACGIVREERAEMHVPDRVIMALERMPGWALRQA